MINPTSYSKRFYRNLQNPEDLIGFRVYHKESDLLIYASKNLVDISIPLLIDCRKPIEQIIKKHPEFKKSLKPIDLKSSNPIIQEMLIYSKKANVGPMAGVAGAIAQCMGLKLRKYSEEIIIENGGDIFISSKKERKILIYAGEESPFKDKIRLKLKGKETPYGICTSSKKIGHSLNMGNTDATVIIARSAIIADIFATAISNMVKTDKDIEKAVEFGMKFKEIWGGVILIGNKASAWGEIEFI